MADVIKQHSFRFKAQFADGTIVTIDLTADNPNKAHAKALKIAEACAHYLPPDQRHEWSFDRVY